MRGFKLSSNWLDKHRLKVSPPCSPSIRHYGTLNYPCGLGWTAGSWNPAAWLGTINYFCLICIRRWHVYRLLLPEPFFRFGFEWRVAVTQDNVYQTAWFEKLLCAVPCKLEYFKNKRESYCRETLLKFFYIKIKDKRPYQGSISEIQTYLLNKYHENIKGSKMIQCGSVRLSNCLSVWLFVSIKLFLPFLEKKFPKTAPTGPPWWGWTFPSLLAALRSVVLNGLTHFLLHFKCLSKKRGSHTHGPGQFWATRCRYV